MVSNYYKEEMSLRVPDALFDNYRARLQLRGGVEDLESWVIKAYPHQLLGETVEEKDRLGELWIHGSLDKLMTPNEVANKSLIWVMNSLKRLHLEMEEWHNLNHLAKDGMVRAAFSVKKGR